MFLQFLQVLFSFWKSQQYKSSYEWYLTIFISFKNEFSNWEIINNDWFFFTFFQAQFLQIKTFLYCFLSLFPSLFFLFLLQFLFFSLLLLFISLFLCLLFSLFYLCFIELFFFLFFFFFSYWWWRRLLHQLISQVI